MKELDSTLAQEFKTQLSTLRNLRNELLAGERAWIRSRDSQCNDKECIARLYLDRTAELKRTAVCGTLADRYKPLAHGHPGELPLVVLNSTPGSGLRLMTTPLATFTQPSTELAPWAALQHPPYSVSPEVIDSLKLMEAGIGGKLEKAPGLNYYSLSNTQGTAHCQEFVSFSMQNGVAVSALNPVPTGESGRCGQGLYYATLNGTAVFLSDGYNYGPAMSTAIDVSTWNSDRFLPACSVQLSFRPHFSDKTLNIWKQSCDGRNCDALRKAAFTLVEAAQGNPVRLLTQSTNELTPAQKSLWEEMRRKWGDAGAQEPTSGSENTVVDPAGYTAESPLRLPMVEDGELYAVSLGHFTIGWRYFADWKATFEMLDNDNLTQRATFAVGMWKGDLESVVITAR